MSRFNSSVPVTAILARGFRTVAAVALLAGAGLANAEGFVTFNTGVDANGVQLAPGAMDPHWEVVAGPGITTPAAAIVLNSQLAGVYFGSTDSRWISSIASGNATVNAPYTYQLTFDLSGFDASTAVLSGQWGADNFGSIFLNGAVPTGTGTLGLVGTVTGNFNVLHAFSITGGFVSGVNTLQFQVVDTGNPSGLNVSGLTASVSAVPEPSTVAMLAAGLVCVFRLILRSRGRSRVAV